MTTELPERRPLRRGEGPTGAQLKSLYDQNHTVREIAQALGGWAYSTVHYRLTKAGTQFRSRGTRRTPAPEIFQEQPGDAT